MDVHAPTVKQYGSFSYSQSWHPQYGRVLTLLLVHADDNDLTVHWHGSERFSTGKKWDTFGVTKRSTHSLVSSDAFAT